MKSNIVALGQSVGSGKWVRVSHIAIHLTAGNFIHAVGKIGVHLAPITHVLDGAGVGWRVIRLRNLTDEDREKLYFAATYFTEQRYEFRLPSPVKNDTSFCSELAVKIYRRAGIEIFTGRNPTSIWPAHFEKEAKLLENWEDVTGEYRKLLTAVSTDHDQALDTLGTAVLQGLTRSTSGAMEGIFRTMEQTFPELKDKVAGIREEMNRAKKMKYWDIPGE